MKQLTLLTLLTLHFSLFTLSASAAVPLKWTVETSRAVPAQFEAYQGETLALEAALQSYGKPLEAPLNYSLYWQTNGMGSAYWSTNVSNVSNLSNPSNLLRATWTPSMETGAKVYNCFIGQPGTIYHAAFQLRLRPSPGETPNELPLPQKVIDFANVTVLNPPWSGGGGGVDTNAVREIAREEIAPATNVIEAQLAELQDGKRDKTDYSITDKKWVAYDLISFVTEVVGSPWYNNNGTWSCHYRVGAGGSLYVAEAVGEEDTELLEFSNTLTIVFRTRLTYVQDSYHVLARRVVYAASALAKFDADGNLVEATGGTDFVAPVSGKGLSQNDYTNADKAEVAKVKDKADEFTAWYGFDTSSYELRFLEGENGWAVYSGSFRMSSAKGDAESLELTWPRGEWFGLEEDFTATRKRVLRTGDAATPQELTNAISTNNPAFVSAVRSISPTPSANIRVFDSIRQCWWIGTMVNGVINWEVE